MTMLYVYGIVNSPSFDGAALNGHDGAGVFPVPCGNCAAVASNLSRREIAPEPCSVWLHEQVLQTLMRQHAVVPIRFGTIVADAGELRSTVRLMHGAFAGDLRRLRRKVEFALRITNIRTEGSPVREAERQSNSAQALPPGTRYLRARAERLRERIAGETAAGRLERRLRRHLDRSADSAVWEPATTRSATLAASYLVARDTVPAFIDAIAAARARHPALHVSCTGPWAPYSFVTARVPETWR